ncbi:DUF485 domain-containing protein [Streptomyces bohaiensis]|uniref:DUF485 domain-containing protein n=1 Tax=Streptomyces bohaiensis TaxID=1431344 RepID=A0ABX1CAX9_9ACTN|nr:DUF485 domain-containing protein [Streptomyces bohaiensis]NJQ16274.1 DUF485 domain-containing protein [Streptomyces bohaiensis]
MTTQPTTTEAGEPPEPDLKARSVVMHTDPRFLELRARLLRFVVPATIAFLCWYLLYVVMSAFARDVMSTQLVGPLNLALLFGLLQFVSTFGIAVAYARYANRRLDPLADDLRTELENGEAR